MLALSLAINRPCLLRKLIKWADCRLTTPPTPKTQSTHSHLSSADLWPTLSDLGHIGQVLTCALTHTGFITLFTQMALNLQCAPGVTHDEIKKQQRDREGGRGDVWDGQVIWHLTEQLYKAWSSLAERVYHQLKWCCVKPSCPALCSSQLWSLFSHTPSHSWLECLTQGLVSPTHTYTRLLNTRVTYTTPIKVNGYLCIRGGAGDESRRDVVLRAGGSVAGISRNRLPFLPHRRRQQRRWAAYTGVRTAL